jgi:predicted site-specific integrase-resolvase
MKGKTYSTPQAAKKIGVALITLHRWLRDGKIRPQGIPMRRGTIWVWTDRDIAKARTIDRTPGPKPRGSAK